MKFKSGDIVVYSAIYDELRLVLDCYQVPSDIERMLFYSFTYKKIFDLPLLVEYTRLL